MVAEQTIIVARARHAVELRRTIVAVVEHVQVGPLVVGRLIDADRREVRIVRLQGIIVKVVRV